MEKDLFRILQELKIDINSIENMDYNKNIRDLTASECSIQVMYISIIEELRKLKKIMRICSTLTFGIYYLKHKKDYEYIKAFSDGMLSAIEEKFEDIKRSKIYYRLEKHLNDEKLNVYKTNYEQIDNFIRLAKNLTDEEKDKYLSYTMN